MLRPGDAAVVEVDRDVAVYHLVPDDDVLSSAAEHHGAARALEDVACYRIAAVAVVKVHAHREDVAALAVRDRAPEVVDAVSDDLVALASPVAPSVKRTRVARLLHDVEDVVPFDQMLVAAVDDRRMGRVVDATADDLVAAAVHRDARRVYALQEGEARDVAPDDAVAALRESAPVAAVQRDAPPPDVAYDAV